MANFKRKRPKNARAGCLMCKPHKMNGVKKDERQLFRDTKRIKRAEEEIKEAIGALLS